MAVTYELSARSRQETGTGTCRRLRKQDKVLGVLYGAGKDPTAIILEHNKLKQALTNEAFYSHIITLDVDGNKERVVLKDLQRHPYKPIVMHVDFQRVSAHEKLTMYVPLHFTGAELAPGAKEGGIVSHLLTEVEVRCLPENLPESIALDISQLGLNGIVHLSQLKMPEGVELVALLHGGAHDLPIVSIHLPHAAPEPTEITTTEVPATKQSSEAKKPG